jgi:hypothetical protein
MDKKNIYESMIDLINNPNSVTSWIFLERTYRDLNLLEESQLIRYYIDNKFEEKQNYVDDTNIS